jgi:UPF0755 protein
MTAATPTQEAPKKPRRLFLKIFLFLVLGGLVIGGYLYWEALKYPDHTYGGVGAELTVTIPKGAGPDKIAEILAQAEVINDPADFSYYLRFSGRLPEVKTGEHTLRDNLTPRQIVDLLAKPPQAVQVSVVIPEGLSMREMAHRFEDAGVCSAEAFLKAARDPALAKEAGLAAKNFEGYLFPDTYRFKPNTDARKVVLAMKKHFDEVFAEVKAAHPAGVAALSRDLKWTDREIVIFASLVEKETGSEDERGFIASVFLNRLLDPAFTPKFLATDPTIIYGLAESPQGFDGDIKSKDLRDTSNPYNTYVHEGLPPGPITNFGRAALEVAVATPPTRCYYFVAKGDGESFFSEKKELHEKAVDIYQRRLTGASAQSLKSAPDCTKQPPAYTRASAAQAKAP